MEGDVELRLVEGVAGGGDGDVEEAEDGAGGEGQQQDRQRHRIQAREPGQRVGAAVRAALRRAGGDHEAGQHEEHDHGLAPHLAGHAPGARGHRAGIGEMRGHHGRRAQHADEVEVERKRWRERGWRGGHAGRELDNGAMIHEH
ncbi:hypothetical protein GCM10027317_43040 [Massilia agri]